jgi:glycosyltransferase involved in cell wall biosynthesis
VAIAEGIRIGDSAQSAIKSLGRGEDSHLTMAISVSVIIPAYNAAQYLAAAIDSVLAQALPATQIIIVDDGSKDATAQIAGKYGDAIWLIRQENAGVSVARNRGAVEATADWLLFFDADDLLRPDALERLARRSTDEDFGVIYGQSEYFTENTGERRLHGKPVAEGPVPAAAMANFWKSALATPGAAIVRADLFASAGGFRSEFNTAADRDFWLRVGMLAEFGYVDGVVIEKREHDANMSGDRSRARQQGAEVQFSFLQWCDERGLARPPVTVNEIVDRNLERALAERSLCAAAWLCDEADRRKISSDMVRRARRLLGMPSFARELELRLRALISR